MCRLFTAARLDLAVVSDSEWTRFSSAPSGIRRAHWNLAWHRVQKSRGGSSTSTFWGRGRGSGVTRLQWARVQVFQKGPLFPPKKFLKTASGKFCPPHSAGPACTARLARPIVTPLGRGGRSQNAPLMAHGLLVPRQQQQQQRISYNFIGEMG